MSRSLPIILVAVSLLLAALNIYQYSDRQNLQDELANEKKRAAAADSDQRRPLAKGGRISPTRKSGTRTASGKSARSPSTGELADRDSPEGEEGFQEIADTWAKMMESPVMQKQMEAQMEAQVGPALADLYAHLGLEGEDLNHFKNLILGRWLAQQQVGMKMMSAAGDPEKNAAIKEELKRDRETTEAKVHEFLNDDADFAYYQDYQKQLPDRIELDQFNTALGAEGLSLGDDQKQQLLTAMGEERAAAELGDVSDPEGWDLDNFTEGTINEVIGKMSDFHQRVQVRASTVLDEAQLQVLTASQEQQRTMQEMGMKMGLQFMDSARTTE